MRSVFISAMLIFASFAHGYIYAQSIPRIQQVDSTKGIDADPTATIIGSETEVCLGDSVAAYLSFSGNGPWDAIINDKDGEYLSLNNVDTPYTIWLKPEKKNRYYIDYVEDKRGRDGKTYGEVEVTVNNPTPVTILLERRSYTRTESGVTLNSEPSGASFLGPGVAGNIFYPYIATPVGSPHTITATYINNFGCKSSDEVKVHVIYGEGEVYLLSGSDTISSLCDDGGTYVISGTNLDNVSGTFELREVGSPDPVEGHILDEDPKDNKAMLDPAGLAGSYYIFYTYTYRNIQVSLSTLFTVNDVGILGIPGLPETVCNNDDPYPLVPQLSEEDQLAVYVFSGPGVSGNQEDGFYFDPGHPDAVVGKNTIYLEYTSSGGCSAAYSVEVINRFVPELLFTLSPVCLPDSGGIVFFENLTEEKDAIAVWTWDFGDPSSGDDNFSALENPDHFYKSAGSKQIVLTATTNEGCVATDAVDTVLTDKPLVDFTWDDDCFVENQAVSFINMTVSTHSILDSVTWTFRKENGDILGVIGSGSPFEPVEFTFSSMGQYLISLQVQNQAGCEAEGTRTLVLYPTLALTDAGYLEHFNGDHTDWISGSDELSISWKHDVPDFSGFIPSAGDRAWFTDLPLDHSGYLEHSWVQSSCFDFTTRTNPYIKLDLMRSFAPGMDGAVLQYQDVVSEGWKNIGIVGDGVNWYNHANIQNLPGGSESGWSLDNFDPDREWVNASHHLNMLAGLSNVKLRIAVATSGSHAVLAGEFNEGFAFDNVYIGERIRRSLLEYFTNSSSLACKEADQMVDQLAQNLPGLFIDLQYHTEYPGVDPMNLNNPFAPSTRSFKYGVQGVPYGILNGGVEGFQRYDFSDSTQIPTEEVLKQGSLELPLFDVDLDVKWNENNLEATTVVTCKVDNFSSNLQLYIAVIESNVTAYPGINGDSAFRNVVLDMIPTPAGKLLGDDWYYGKADTRVHTWNYVDYIEDTEELAVVAFVQNRDNGEVLQVTSEFLTPLVHRSSVWSDGRSITLYPNPASDWLNINLGNKPVNSGEIRIINLSGRTIMTSEVHPDHSLYTIDISNLSGGLYILHLVESGAVTTRKKLVVAR